MKTSENNSNLYAGVFLILLGITFLANNFGWIDVSFSQISHMWPLLLIFWGLRYLAIREPWRAIVNFGMMILFFGLLFTSRKQHFSFHFDFSRNESREMIADDADDDAEAEGTGRYDVVYSIEMNNDIRFGTLKMNIPTSDFHLEKTTNELFRLVGEDIFFGLKKEVDIQGNRAVISFKPEKRNVDLHSRFSPDIDLQLNAGPVWDMDISTGASSLEMDLRPFKVRRVTVESGASSVDLTLGNKLPDTRVKINSGASSVHLNVPEDAGVEVRFSDVMSTRMLEGFKKKRKNIYVTENFDKAGHKIYINIESALGSFEVDRY